MLTRALEHGIEEGALPEAAYTPEIVDGTAQVDEDFLAAYLAEDDARVILRLVDQETETVSRRLIHGLLDRRLLRRVASIPLHRERGRELDALQFGRIVDPSRFGPRIKELEEAIAGELGCEPWEVAINIDNRRNPTYRTPGAEIQPRDVFLRSSDGDANWMEEDSEIFSEEQRPEFSYAYLYAPTDQSQDQRAKELLWEALKSV